jgi:hypothetical protein
MSGATQAALAGKRLVADDLYLMAHHELTGRPYPHPHALGLGLSGALLAELILIGHIRADHGTVAVVDPAPQDGLGRAVLGPVLWHLVRDWLAFLIRPAQPARTRQPHRASRLLPQQRLDRDVEAAYLEAATQVNRDIYLRHGYLRDGRLCSP